jgi:hypothetical protein
MLNVEFYWSGQTGKDNFDCGKTASRINKFMDGNAKDMISGSTG